jgi:hypothetical protein
VTFSFPTVKDYTLLFFFTAATMNLIFVIPYQNNTWKMRQKNIYNLSQWLSFLIPPDVLGPVVYEASNRNEYQKQKNNISGE